MVIEFFLFLWVTKLQANEEGKQLQNNQSRNDKLNTQTHRKPNKWNQHWRHILCQYY